MGRKVKRGQAGKKGVDPFRPAVWAGDSVSEAPATTLSYSPPTVGAKSPGLRGLEPTCSARAKQQLNIQHWGVQFNIYKSKGDSR